LSITPALPMIGVMLGDARGPARFGRSLRRIPVAMALALGALVLGGTAASAHPIGNFTLNLYSGIVVAPGTVRVDYVVEMAEISTQEQKPGMDVDGDGEITAAERDGWADRAARSILTNLSMVADGIQVELRLTDSSLRFRPGQGGLDLLYLQATYVGEPPEAGSVVYTDGNYATRPGWREITVRGEPGVAIVSSTVPEDSVSDELKSYPAELIDEPLNVREARFDYEPSDGAIAPPASPTPAGTGSSSPGGSGGFADLLATSSDRAIGFLLLLAFGFGFVHALGPGHGKTIMAASTLSGSVRLRHAIGLGGGVALMHCATVVGLGLIAYAASQTISSDRVFSALRLLTAIIVLVVGAVLLVVRWRQHRHVAEPGATHEHGHRGDHGHRHPDPDARGIDRASLAAVAASGGLIPSPSAVIVLLAAIAADRIPLGIALVVIFSLGLAASLVLVGTLAHYARSWIGRTETRIGAWLPLAAAAAIFVVGIVLTIQAADAVRVLRG
jgi:nickel/cobalt transporter (NicO) family protein